MIRYKNAQIIKHCKGLNFQEVAIQGQITYRLEQPLEAAQYLDFSIEPKNGQYKSSDPDKLGQRVINALQAHTRKGINKLSLEKVLTTVKEFAGNAGKIGSLNITPDMLGQLLGWVGGQKNATAKLKTV